MKASYIQLLVALILHSILIISIGMITQNAILIQILSSFFILNCIGYCCILANQHKIGAFLFLWSSIPFLPIGLIGTLGARKVIDLIPKTDFMKIVYSSKQ